MLPPSNVSCICTTLFRIQTLPQLLMSRKNTFLRVKMDARSHAANRRLYKMKNRNSSTNYSKRIQTFDMNLLQRMSQEPPCTTLIMLRASFSNKSSLCATDLLNSKLLKKRKNSFKKECAENLISPSCLET